MTRDDGLTVDISAWSFMTHLTYLDENDKEQTLGIEDADIFFTIQLAVWNTGSEMVMPPGAEQFGLINRPAEDTLKAVAPSMKFPEGITWSDIVFDENSDLRLLKPTFVDPSPYYQEIDAGTNQPDAQHLTLLFHWSFPMGTTYLRWHSDQQIEGANKPVFFELRTRA